MTSPAIESIEWGQVKVAGEDTPYKDVKLFPGGSRDWDWKETGTHHFPGIQVADVKELLENGAREIVLAKGYWNRLRVRDTTKLWLHEHNIPFHILSTGDAAALYNRLCEDQMVGALIHTTC